MKLKSSSLMSKKNKKKGFSLVELMVVVAIIGILAVIGIPQYQKFMSKARQAEAKTHLNAIFQSENSFFTEYNTYTGNLSVIGAGAVGQALRYNAGFIAAPCTGETGLSPVTTTTNNTIREVTTSGATWHWGTAGLADTGNTNVTCGGAAYNAGAWGNPTNIQDGTNNNADVFAIDNNRLLRQLAVGM
jgi:prepilin-type N-terminal cleavage/methylation domain-containing protein